MKWIKNNKKSVVFKINVLRTVWDMRSFSFHPRLYKPNHIYRI
jgi:hypothetical protein